MRDYINATILKENKLFYTNFGDDHKEEVNLNPFTNPIMLCVLSQLILDLL